MSTSPLIDRRHLDFVLRDLLDAGQLSRYPRFAEHSRDTFDAAIDLAHRIAVEKFLPHNRKSDLNEPQLVDGHVRLIPEIGEALRAYNNAGFTAVMADVDKGGLQLPFVIATACDALFAAANLGTSAYPALARAAANLLDAHASDDQKRRYMRPILDGRWFGTMCLSEPQAGSSLGDITTMAAPQADGTYKITGAKMWISAGEHELGENIVHLLLAKIVGAPAGVRGISLFIVPRFKVAADGSIGASNDARLAGLNHKMGQRGSVNTFLKFGEQDDCIGELVGQPHHGLGYMFHMMNEERIGVGVGAVQQGSAGYLYSLRYARERRQGRHPDQKDASTLPVAIIEHADVRRMLLQQKCYVEAGQLLCLYAALQVDRAQDADAGVQRDATLLLDLLTPIVKSWGSDSSLKANELAIQVLGGYGYTRDYPVEQFYRDNRINPIHEGTNGIQALDLLGRKVMQQDGAALKLLFAAMSETCLLAGNDVELRGYAQQLQHGMRTLGEVTLGAAQRMAAGEARAVLANATHYMTALSTLTVSWLWLWMAEAATRTLALDDDFRAGKRQACRFWFATEYAQLAHAAQLVGGVDRSALDMQSAWF
ncbi:MAG: acyl-CoA dehydrogenase [Rhodanobacteraceae bacterium]|nr:acyl-CoA dehydrogenase [Rhodanobacteraceae bacterium]MBK7043564.1 acyl-CoA dehydrogenase [Rhodanobacteraceae bacterium]MBP9154951.1 acyl-CoA dehydrogenase [Xanthomonadales bacterium]HQW82375.1 acyl-CoA dehydrogenase [Pseudomonadota bacterium]